MFRRILSVLALLGVLVPSLCAADQVYFYHTDPAGTPLAMTDSGGTVVWKADYKPFGEENSTSGSTANDKRFVGKEKDQETGLSYFGARYEDARLGRFIAPDPVRAVDQKDSKTNEKLLADPQRLNKYPYAVNNPYRYVDQDGREAIAIPGMLPIFIPPGSVFEPGSHSNNVFVSSSKEILQLFDPRPLLNIISKNYNNDSSSRLPTGSKPIDQTPWSGDHKGIKDAIGAGPKDKVFIAPGPNADVWAKNPDGSYENKGPAGTYTGSGKPSGQRGKDREKK